MAPFDALDIYDNIFHGRILGIYGANPFRDVIADFPEDVFYEYPYWKHSRSAYGPVWEGLAGLTARLAGNGIVMNVLAFKMLPGAFHLASVAIVFFFLRRVAPERALAGVLILGWNPVALYEVWGNGHNDIAMIFWVLLAAVLIAQKRYTLATLSLVLGALIKFIPLLLVPAALLIGFHAHENVRSRFWFVFKTSFAAVLLIVAAYYPFWNGLASLSLSRRMKPSMGLSDAARLVSLSALVLLTVFTLVQTFRTQRQEPSGGFLQAAFNVFAFYLMVTCLWFQQWYGIWLVGLAPLLSERSRRFVIVFGFWVLSKQLVFAPLIVPAIGRRPEAAAWLEALLALAVLGIPWLYASLSLRTSKRLELAHAAA
jgi:hypothetical protein